MSCLHPVFQLAAQTTNMYQLEGTPGLEVAGISACLSPDQMSLSLSATQQTGWWANTMPACQGAECPEGYHTMLCKSTSELAEELKDLRSVNRFSELLYSRESRGMLVLQKAPNHSLYPLPRRVAQLRYFKPDLEGGIFSHIDVSFVVW